MCPLGITPKILRIYAPWQTLTCFLGLWIRFTNVENEFQKNNFDFNYWVFATIMCGR